ncbi:hypothetical protein PPE_05720 [Paenibacillus polymyxa E681]|nr:hypothetical protein PPE_05720 [Paenibacillus polymyxa E681]
MDGGSRSCSGTEKHAEYTVPKELRLKFEERPDL